MQAPAAGAGLPRRAGRVLAQRREFFPVAPAIARPKEGRIFDARIQQIRIVQRGLEMPDACELPWMWRSVVPCVRSGLAVVDELVADRLPRCAAIIRTLNELPKPTRRLRGIDPIRIGWRAFHMIDFPTAEMRPLDLPSEVRTNAPLRVPTSSRTELIFLLCPSVSPAGELQSVYGGSEALARATRR